METDECNSDDEVFVGEITERERNHPAFNSRRRTTVYFPGVSKPDSNITVYEELTNDGTLLFSCEEEPSNNINNFDHCIDSPIITESDMSDIAEEKLSEKDGLFRSRSTRTKLLNTVPFSDHEPEEDGMDSGFNSVSDASLSSTQSPQLPLPETNLKANKIFWSKDGERKQRQFSDVEKFQACSYLCPGSGNQRTIPFRVDASGKACFSLGDDQSLMNVNITNTSPSITSQNLINKRAFNTSDLNQRCSNTNSITSDITDKFLSTSKMSTMDSSVEMSFADSGYVSPLPLKRKVAPKRQSPSSDPKNVLENQAQNKGVPVTTNHESVFQFQGKHSPSGSESAKKAESYRGVSGCSLFDLTFMSTKLQKLDIDCECEKTSDKTKHTKIMSTLDSNAFTVRNADVIEPVLSGRNQIFVPETPDIKRTAFISSNQHNIFSKGFIPSQDQLEEEVPEIIPSSQGAETCASPVCATLDITMTPDKIDSTDSFPKLQTPQLTGINGSLHSPTCISPDLFSSPPLDKSSLLSSPVGSAHSLFPNSHKYGRLNLRKPMATASKKNKENKGKESFYASHSTFSCMSTIEDNSRAAMTRINTMINGEKRHYLLDPQSSPALLTDYPPPRQASRVSWSDSLIEEPGIRTSTAQKPTTPRSILQQRADDVEFPFSEEPPSPIVLTRRRQQKPTRLVMFNS